MTYKFKKHRTPAKPILEKLETNTVPEDEPMGLIQGQIPDSKQEWWVAKALDRLHIPYQYQYPVNGGRARGGYMIDFLVFTVPLATMVEPKGNHWHTGELGKDDLKRQADVENAMRDIAKTPILNLWIPDMINQESVFMRLKQELR